MTSWTDPSVVAASASAVAAIAAAVAAWRGPITAANMAERLRRRGEAAVENRRIKFSVFAQLMQERAEIYSVDAVKALNSIDVAYSDCSAVREAWSELHGALSSQPMAPPHILDERIRRLLREMATVLGIGDKLRVDDFGRVYFPIAISDERKLQDLQRRAAIAQLTHASGGTPAVTTDSLFPPKPA